MQTTCGIHYARHLTRLEGKGGLLECLLHVALAKVAEVSLLAGAAAVGLGDGQLTQAHLAARDTGLVALDDLAGVFLGAGDLGLERRKYP